MATRDAFYREARTDLDGPLEGVRVLDVTTTVAGPRCGCVLADYGAEVIKIELSDPEDVARRLPPILPGTDPPDSYVHATINRNKKNISLDLRRARGRDVFHRLIQNSDILVENFKQGTMARWGCGYEQARQTRLDIIYVSITGFGQYGPYSGRPGYDPVAQAMSGFMQLNADSDEAVPMKAPVFLADEIAALHGVMAALAALQHRNRTGEGQHVDVSLLDSMIDSSTGLLSLAAQGVPTPRLGNTYAFAAPANAYRCRDGWVYALVVLDTHWKRLCGLLGRPELGDDPDYATLQARLGKRQEMDQMLSDWCRSRTREEVIKSFESEQLAAGPVLTPAETARDPHVVHREAIQEVTGKSGGTYRLAGPSAKFSRTPIRIRSRAPGVGEHSREVLAEAGFSGQEIEELAADGIIYCAVREVC